MLGGLDPIIIFQFKKLAPSLGAQLAKIPIVAKNAPSLIDMPPIPIYLSESLTGIFIESETKSVDIDTDVQTLTNGEEPKESQKGVASTISIDLVGKKGSIGLILFSSLIDLAFEKCSSDEYSITYLHGATTIFRAKLHNFQAVQGAQNDLLNIKVDLSRGAKSPLKLPTIPSVPRAVGATPLS